MSGRLNEIAKLICVPVLVDVGADHASLIVKLLKAGRINFGIAIENKRLPFENSVRALERMQGEARLGDGLNPVSIGEADCLSICGMGARNILRILNADPDKIPDQIVLQPSNHTSFIRKWAWHNDFHLITEISVGGNRPYNVLSFRKSVTPGVFDPAYDSIELESGFMFGPLTIKRFTPEFVSGLKEEANYWGRFDRLEPPRLKRLELIRVLLERVNVEMPSD